VCLVYYATVPDPKASHPTVETRCFGVSTTGGEPFFLSSLGCWSIWDMISSEGLTWPRVTGLY